MNWLSHLIFPRNKFGHLALLAIIFVAGAYADQPKRAVMRAYFQEAYGQQVFRCDNAMREHFIAKSQAAADPTEISANALHQAEIGLIDCHEYDVYRKSLLSLGLEESDLSIMGLKAIEARGADIQQLVRVHEIRY